MVAKIVLKRVAHFRLICLEVDKQRELEESLGTTTIKEPGNNSKKRGRGPSKLINLAEGETILVAFNELMQPIGPNRPIFMSYLGNVARNGIRLPLTYETWRDILEDILDRVWTDIQSKSTVPPAYRSNCMKSLDAKWRAWKIQLKKSHFINKNKEEALANVPSRVEPEQ